MAEGEKYTTYQEKYPLIQLSLKSGKQADFELAYKMLKKEIIREFERHRYVVDFLEEPNRNSFLQILSNTADDSEWYQAIAFLSRCLEEYHKERVIILIDEYDVPLENAYYCSFYDKMIAFIRSLFESALKSNLSLEFAVITGCLRITSILNTSYSEYFGFIQSEIDEILSYYQLDSKSELIRQWYDGYTFGNVEVYNPWSLVNYISDLNACPDALPIEYWSNTSSNLIIKDLLTKSTEQMRDELEILVQDGSIKKMVHEDITYQDIYESEENLWNFLLFTGYLKAVDVKMAGDDRIVELKIPNKEIKKIYRQQIMLWSRSNLCSRDLTKLYQAVLSGNAEAFQKELSKLLISSVSYIDNAEDFYHGFLLGILMNLEGYQILSNREAGNGRYDLCIISRDGTKTPVILEFKIAKNRKLLQDATRQALEQIHANRYDAPFADDGYDECIHIGIGFCKKMCLVACEKVKLEAN